MSEADGVDLCHSLFCRSITQPFPPIRILSFLVEKPHRVMLGEKAPTRSVILLGVTQESRDTAQITMEAGASPGCPGANPGG